MKTILLIPVLVVGLALASCGGDDDDGDGAPGPAPALGMGPGISIEEAVAAGSDEPLLVNGNLLADGGVVRLCSALAESFPPQCGGESLVVLGLAYTEVEGAVTVEGVTWSDRPIQVLGVVRDGTITVSENVNG